MPSISDFRAKEKYYQEVFSNKFFTVPRYQRAFAWTNVQLEDLHKDLSSQDHTFIGAFVFLDNGQSLDIIDGQQRFTTLTILFCALRDLAFKYEFLDTAQRINEKEIKSEDINGNFKYILKSGFLTHNFLKNYIFDEQVNKNNIPSDLLKHQHNVKILECYNYFYNTINKELIGLKTSTEKKDLISKYRTKIKNLTCIEIIVKDNDVDAYEIFEKLNATGMALNPADLIKNLIFKNLQSDEDEDVALLFWEELHNNVANTKYDEQTFIRYYWNSIRPFVQGAQLYASIKKDITDWSGLITGLEQSAKHFNDLVENGDFSDFSEPSGPHEHFKNLKDWNLLQHNVLMLTFYRHLSKEGFQEYFTKSYNIIEQFSFLYFKVSDLKSNAVEKYFSKTANNLEAIVSEHEGDSLKKHVDLMILDMQKDLKSYLPNKIQLIENFINNIKYKRSVQGKNLIRYILGKYNEDCGSTNELDYSNIHIEHILPQNPHESWGEELSDKNNIKDFVDSIGNLTLLSQPINISSRNHNIELKKPKYSESEIKITSDNLISFLNEKNDKWNEKIIKTRSTKIAETIIDTFDIFI